MKKHCFKCGINKNITEFYVHKKMGDGHLGKCKKCTKKDVQDRYDNPEARLKIAEYERKRFKDPERKKKIYLYALKRKKKHPKKHKSRWMVTSYIKRGILVKKPCEICGEIKSQAHHTDYRKPLEVKWLCFKHHREEHGQKITIK